MTHAKIAFLKRCNSLILNNLCDSSIHNLFIFFLNQRLIILYILICFSPYVHAQSPQRAIQLSKAYQTKAAWFLKLPQFNKESAEIYFDKAIKVLNKNEPKNFQVLSEAYFKLLSHFYRSNFTTKVDDAITKVRYDYDKIPNKSENTKIT